MLHMRSVKRRFRRTAWGLVGGAGVLAVLGTAGDEAGGRLPHHGQRLKDMKNPALAESRGGPWNVYDDVIAEFYYAFGGYGESFVIASGVLTDELTPNQGSFKLDQRVVPANQRTEASTAYLRLERVRQQAQQAIRRLDHSQSALAGHLYALQGYTEVLLAELFCSGIPLSVVDSVGTVTHRPGSTTDQVFAHATALFDTALTLAGDSTRIMNLARVGRARALLGQGQYAAAATAVAAVADSYRYHATYTAIDRKNRGIRKKPGPNFATVDDGHNGAWAYLVADREGGNGLDWRTSGDPRTPIGLMDRTRGRGTRAWSANRTGVYTRYYLYYPLNHDSAGASPIVLASGVEARLIEAEAALQAGDTVTWLATLNALRTSGASDTTWPPGRFWYKGSGGVHGLAPLTDPGTAAARVDLLFRERGFWLFLTGHRQGDLRRLIRQYGRAQDEVYPSGPYFFGKESYGSDVTALVPRAKTANPLYTGCISRDA